VHPQNTRARTTLSLLSASLEVLIVIVKVWADRVLPLISVASVLVDQVIMVTLMVNAYVSNTSRPLTSVYVPHYRASTIISKLGSPTVSVMMSPPRRGFLSLRLTNQPAH